jgi:hypothetical protein
MGKTPKPPKLYDVVEYYWNPITKTATKKCVRKWNVPYPMAVAFSVRDTGATIFARPEETEESKRRRKEWEAQKLERKRIREEYHLINTVG